MREQCSKCGNKLVLAKGYLAGLEADEEPYTPNEWRDINLPEYIDDGVGVNMCPECGYIEDVWPNND